MLSYPGLRGEVKHPCQSIQSSSLCSQHTIKAWSLCFFCSVWNWSHAMSWTPPSIVVALDVFFLFFCLAIEICFILQSLLHVYSLKPFIFQAVNMCVCGGGGCSHSIVVTEYFNFLFTFLCPIFLPSSTMHRELLQGCVIYISLYFQNIWHSTLNLANS